MAHTTFISLWYSYWYICKHVLQSFTMKTSGGDLLPTYYNYYSFFSSSFSFTTKSSSLKEFTSIWHAMIYSLCLGSQRIFLWWSHRKSSLFFFLTYWIVAYWRQRSIFFSFFFFLIKKCFSNKFLLHKCMAAAQINFKCKPVVRKSVLWY